MFKNNRCIDPTYANLQQQPEVAAYKKDFKSQGFMNQEMCCENFKGVECPPIMECPQERVCHRQINHCVRHICPCNTRIVNHHIYHHTYDPCFTCCEENVVCNVYDNKCCF